MSTSARRTLVALATTAALLPAVPALAQTATPTPSGTPTAAPTTLTGFSASKLVIDYGDTVDVTVTGTPGLPISLLLNNQRIPEPRVIRTATIGANGRFTWTGLRPEDSSTFTLAGVTVDPVFGTPPPVTVRVRRDVTIGVSQANGVYTFTGRVQRDEPGVQVTIARLDSETKRVTGVASTTTDATGRYVIRTGLPQGLAGYYALTEARNGLDAGRSRLYGLIVNTRPGTATPPPSTSQGLTLGVRRAGNSYSFEGVLSPARGGVPVTLAQIVNGQLRGMAGGVTEANGRYIITIQPPPGTYQFTALTANARSRNYGLVVPQPVVPACSATSIRRSHDDSAQCMFRAYKAGDWAAVANYALPPVIALLRQGRAYDVRNDFNWSYYGCGTPEYEDLSDFPPASSGVACTFYANANPGEVHGVTVEFNMDRFFRAESYNTVG